MENEIDDVIFKLTMEDVKYVIENMDEEDKKKLDKYSDEEIQDVISRKMEIPWDEYIEAVLKARLIY